MSELTILSGVKPSGRLHLGNFFGMVKPMLDMKNAGSLLFFVADLHSLTTTPEPEKHRSNIREMLIDLAVFADDVTQSTLWVQSDVPAVTELMWYLNSLTPLSLLLRNHTIKQSGDNPVNMGVLSYPILQAADILIAGADVVPVGRDQQQHIEIARVIASRFNNTYGKTFKIPEWKIVNDKVPGTDGRKMSKSYGNTIPVFGEESEIKKAIMKIVTDSAGVTDPKNPESSIIYNIYRLLASESDSLAFADRFIRGGLGYGEAKNILLEMFMEYFKPFREKRKRLAGDMNYINAKRCDGAGVIQQTAEGILAKIKMAVGVI